MTQKMTLAITTYRRPEMLTRCLNSLTNQTLSPKNIIVIDNDPQKSAQNIVKIFQKKLDLKYLNEKHKGTPHARNFALKFCSTPYLAFIDDDCFLEKDWFKRVTSLLKNTKFNYVIGHSKLLNSANICARAQYLNQQTWFKNELTQKPFSPSLFDTKNIVINMSVVQKYHLQFDSIYGNFNFSGFEDTDMGYQFAQHQCYGTYDSKLVVYHQEPEKFFNSIKKAYYRGRLKRKFDQKWHLTSHPTPFIYHLKKIITSKNIVSFIAEIFQISFDLGYSKT